MKPPQRCREASRQGRAGKPANERRQQPEIDDLCRENQQPIGEGIEPEPTVEGEEKQPLAEWAEGPLSAWLQEFANKLVRWKRRLPEQTEVIGVEPAPEALVVKRQERARRNDPCQRYPEPPWVGADCQIHLSAIELTTTASSRVSSSLGGIALSTSKSTLAVPPVKVSGGIWRVNKKC